MIQPNTSLHQARTAAERISLSLQRQIGTAMDTVTTTYPEALTWRRC